jgi:hypothetical protein
VGYNIPITITVMTLFSRRTWHENRYDIITSRKGIDHPPWPHPRLPRRESRARIAVWFAPNGERLERAELKGSEGPRRERLALKAFAAMAV